MLPQLRWRNGRTNERPRAVRLAHLRRHSGRHLEWAGHLVRPSLSGDDATWADVDLSNINVLSNIDVQGVLDSIGDDRRALDRRPPTHADAAGV